MTISSGVPEVLTDIAVWYPSTNLVFKAHKDWKGDHVIQTISTKEEPK